MNGVGVRLLKDAISIEEESDVLMRIYDQQWLDIYARRVQHYGYKYEYRTRGLQRMYTDDDPSKGIPSWLVPKCVREEIAPEQIIVNEYTDGQGISSHRDALCFGPKILSLSLGANTVMTFTGGMLSIDIPLPRRSLLILEGPARYRLEHQIKKHTGDIRVSITYRTLAKGVTTSK